MKLRTAALLTFLLAGVALAQQGPDVTISPFAPMNPAQKVYGYTGANLIYTCTAKTDYPLSGPVSISAGTNASPVVFTSTGHGFNTASRPIVSISGGTGNWAAVNGDFVATIVDTNTFSIPVDSTAFGAVTGTIVFRTQAPRLNQPQWSVIRYFYDGSNNLISSVWLGGSSALRAKCSDATSSTNNIQ